MDHCGCCWGNVSGHVCDCAVCGWQFCEAYLCLHVDELCHFDDLEKPGVLLHRGIAVHDEPCGDATGNTCWTHGRNHCCHYWRGRGDDPVHRPGTDVSL